MTQHYTSAATSINSVKLPAIYSKLSDSAYLWASSYLDFGCGRYTRHIADHVATKAYEVAQNAPREYRGHMGIWHGYDAYNQSEEENDVELEAFRSESEFFNQMVICSNVLNVIDSEETIAWIAARFMAWADAGAAVMVTVYEGDRSGIGRATKTDCYQRNEKIVNYLKYFDKNFTIKKGVITNRPEFVKSLWKTFCIKIVY